MIIPSFIGLHPSSFGITNYAYTKLNDNNELIELRESKVLQIEDIKNMPIQEYIILNLMIYSQNMLKT